MVECLPGETTPCLRNDCISESWYAFTMPHYLDEYAPQTGRWKSASGRRFDLVEIDPAKTKLAPGRPCAVTDSEEAAALFFGFIPAGTPNFPRVPKKPALSQRKKNDKITTRQLVKLLLRKGGTEVTVPVVINGKNFEVVVRRKPEPLTKSHEAEI